MAGINSRSRRSNPPLPKEVQQYYQSQRRERVGLAWLLGLGTIVVTILLGTGLFFGGRAIYRSVHKKNNPPAVAQNKPSTSKSTTPTPQTPATTTPAPSTTPTTPTTPPPTPPVTTSTTPTTPPTTPKKVPNTGPGNLALIVFAVVSTGATLLHAGVLRRRRFKAELI